ncbi:DUF3800 domain-containing protein [Coleofasciculus sp. H7-2]|uniref:DUF3800 domain-containing protein n=1 Tax=Coleofasciculus sp. H7-2 TaxID=3351545 RepID=UPI00366BDC7D
MAYFLFVDESGQDHRNSPYEVLAGVAIEDRDLWNLIQAIQAAEIRHFGTRYSNGDRELKARELLKKKVYRLAAQLELIPEDERQVLARSCLEAGATAGKRELTALAQAKLAYVSEVFDICSQFRCKAFASIVSTNAPVLRSPEFLRKDYAYLFERFFYFLEDINPSISGIVVFDELDKSQSHLLVQQMDRYFKHSTKGRQRSGQIIPEPFFVHSDLTTGIQIADLVAYIVSWGFRTNDMSKPARLELNNLVNQVCQIRYRAIREVEDNPNFAIWSFAVITDLRTKEQQN